MKYALLLLLAIPLCTACKKGKIPRLDEAFQYTETYCSDPWNNQVEQGDNFLEDLEIWLELKTGKAIRKPYMKFFRDKMTMCYACSCTSGNVIYVWPPAGSEQKFLDLGFRKP
ncbi:hypothetical protein [Chitinophaga rhizosphaerae]|uniref:hypothetical protein n=1 Tax=Chitinophaga rhizosphaerae TaxID=1864947 RepID=UPI000F80BF46|nr:hypothetical protein [Chitinophaga rhizosphaerae]